MPEYNFPAGAEKSFAGTAIVTGAASGIGLYLAKRLLAENWQLTAMDVQFSALHSVLSNMAGEEQLLLLNTDVSQAAAWESALHQTLEKFGAVDLVINNAGIIIPALIENSGPALIDRHVDINLKGVMYGTSLCAAQMIRAGRGGHIINLSSMAGIAPVPGIGAYSASKFGVRAYSLIARQELRSRGIAVTCVCPDLVDTPMLDEQLKYDEAAITFSGPGAMSVQRVGDAILRSLKTRPAELIIPDHRGWLSKIASMFPSLMQPLKRIMEEKGRRRAEQYRHRGKT